MKNYKNSDYAVNKYASGIVYRHNCEIIHVTLEDYLAENPEKTEQDFFELKELSDSIYHEQDRNEYAQTKLNDSIHNMKCADLPSIQSFENDYIERMDKQYSIQALQELFESKTLTEIQERRLKLYIFAGLSFRQIADKEGTSHIAVWKSIQLAIEKLKKYFYLQG